MNNTEFLCFLPKKKLKIAFSSLHFLVFYLVYFSNICVSLDVWVCPLQSFPFCNSNTCKRVTLFNHVWSYFLATTGAMSFLIHRQLTFEFHNSRVQWTSVRFHWALCLSVDRFVSSLTTVKSFFLLQLISSFSMLLTTIKRQLWNSSRWSMYIISSVDKTKII